MVNKDKVKKKKKVVEKVEQAASPAAGSERAPAHGEADEAKSKGKASTKKPAA